MCRMPVGFAFAVADHVREHVHERGDSVPFQRSRGVLSPPCTMVLRALMS
jgi:hypothetical protein